MKVERIQPKISLPALLTKDFLTDYNKPTAESIQLHTKKRNQPSHR